MSQLSRVSLLMALALPVTLSHASAHAHTSHQEASAYETQVIGLINAHRASVGLPSLETNPALQALACQHSDAMAAASKLNHTGFTDRATEIRSVLGARGVAENVAAGQTSAEAVVSSWLHSEKHRINLEGAYTVTGLGASQDSRGVWFYTQIFAEK